MNPKITEQHQRKPAYVYLRQSTPGQVRHHRESTERQYALREKARELGWSEAAIHILDRDLGMSGSPMAGREDFKTLVAGGPLGGGGGRVFPGDSRRCPSSLYRRQSFGYLGR